MIKQRINVVLVVLALLGASGFAKENVQPLNDDELSAATCMLASQGIYYAATYRQAGESKADAKKQLDADLKKLRTSLSSVAYVQRISDVWYRGLDRIYQMPVFELPEEREAFVSIMTEDALVSCMHSLMPE